MKKLLLALIATAMFTVSAHAAPDTKKRDTVCMPFIEFLQTFVGPNGLKVVGEMVSKVDDAGMPSQSVDILFNPQTKQTVVVEVTRHGQTMESLEACILAAFRKHN